MKAMTRYEAVLATECSVGGCNVVLKGNGSAAKKPRFLWNVYVGDVIGHKDTARYLNKGKSLLILILLAGLVAKTFFSIEIASFAQTSSEAGAYDVFSEVSGVADSVPGYQEYKESFAAVYPKQEIRVRMEDCVRYEMRAAAADVCVDATKVDREYGYTEVEMEVEAETEAITGAETAAIADAETKIGMGAEMESEGDQTGKPVIHTAYQGISGEWIYTAEGSLAEFSVSVEEEGFYNILLEYYLPAGNDSAAECSILIDGEAPYRELARVCYDRVWTLDGGLDKAEWITGVTCDRTRQNAEPLSVYLTKGRHTVSLISIKGPMLLHQIIFSQKKPSADYRQVKGFWDAVGIRAAQGNTVMIKGKEAVRTSLLELYHPVQEDAGISVFPTKWRMYGKEAGRSVIGGDSWEKAGAWIEWEFDVAAAGYYHITVSDLQNYVRGADAYRKILMDGECPFQEMERYAFAYGMGWKEDTLADDTGTPYVFYLKEGRHTFRMEAVPGEKVQTDQGVIAAETVRPLAVDWIRIMPAGQ